MRAPPIRPARPLDREGRRPAPPPPAFPRHPASLLAILVAAACVLASVSFVLFETDFWQHLLVGRVLWQTHGVPDRQIWVWPTYGVPDITPSWGFRVILWPFWSVGGVWGLFAWRWLTTLAVFGILWMTARRMGARGLAGLVVVVLAALVYRQRSQIRPETLASVLLALELWILECRRQGGRDHTPWLVPIAWVWANSHISYFLGPVVLGLYQLGSDDTVARRNAAAGPRGGAGGGTPRLLWVGLAMVAISFVNPYGWRALWQPFEFALFRRHELIFETIGELRPVMWWANWMNGLPVLIFGWPALIVWRWRRGRPDMVEALVCALFTALGVGTQRFLGFYAVACVPFAARDIDEWLAARRRPAWSAGPWVRASMVSALCVIVGLPEWSRSAQPLGIRIDMRRFPVAACDFMAAHGVRGRGFNPFYFGGYMLWRFWPDRDRLPFMDIHQSGTDEDRRLYGRAMLQRNAWATLDRRHHFDYLLLNRVPARSGRLADLVDRDSSWTLVFIDDAAALFVRRDGPLRAMADSFAYRWLPAGRAGWAAVAARCQNDSLYRAAVGAELARSVAGSPTTSGAHSQLANIAILDGRTMDARRELEAALAGDPFLPTAHERLGRLALTEGRARDALREFTRERSLGPQHPGLDLDIGRAYEALGDSARAKAAYRRARVHHPASRAGDTLDRRLVR
jgi:hypothetical protein